MLNFHSLSLCTYDPPPPLTCSRVSHSANKEWHVGLVTPQQHDERPHGQEGRVGAREDHSADSAGLHSLFGQFEEGSVSGTVQSQLPLREEATQVGILEER